MKKLILLMIILSVVSVIFAAGKTLEIIAQETAKEGETLFAQKKFVEAGEKFQEAIEKYNEFVTKNDIPEDKTIIEKWLKNAKISYQNGKAWEKMIAVLDIYIERHPRIYKNYSTKALIYKKYMNPKNYEAAIDAYVSFDESVKPYYKARVKVADIYYNNLEDYENALVWYKKANELKSTSKILNLTSKTYLKLKRNKEAIAVLKEYISTNPSSKEKFNSYYNLGTIYMNDLGNVTEALANYENAVSFKFDK
ncbi:MAG: tetratricopeptide repeat protein, partial [Candidatus Cloacimonadota bacterium]|nr:tetratricopeptide repeat protein [Candidatus Cloacimonadota bacterium]